MIYPKPYSIYLSGTVGPWSYRNHFRRSEHVRVQPISNGTFLPYGCYHCLGSFWGKVWALGAEVWDTIVNDCPGALGYGVFTQRFRAYP